MQIYEMSHPNLNTYVRYKILAPAEVEMLVEGRSFMARDQHRKFILEAVIYNLADVTEQLRPLDKNTAKEVVNSLYNGSMMLNPGLDLEYWVNISRGVYVDPEDDTAPTPRVKRGKKTARAKKLTKAKFLNLERYLQDRVIGQDEAISEITKALKRSLVGLNDAERPLGVFLFAGASGVGKTHLARELHKYLFDDGEIVRVDCGEYQGKHETAKLIGSPPGYIGHDEGGSFANAVKKNPATVVLLDEVEKAHPDIWHTFLRIFDEGFLTDSHGQAVDFRNTIIIMTTNLGNREVVNSLMNRPVGFDNGVSTNALPPRSRVERLAREEIRKNFSPEFINRIDKIITFNHLTEKDLLKIAELELQSIDNKLALKGLSLKFDDMVVEAMVKTCDSHVQGARKLAQIRRDDIENYLADFLLTGRYPRGTIFSLTWDQEYRLSSYKPIKTKEVE